MSVLLVLPGIESLHAQGSTPPHNPDSANTVAAPAAIKLAFSQQPTNTSAGALISPAVTVQLKDNAGKDLLQAGVSITLALSSGTGTLSGKLTRSTNALGLATFDTLSINLVGSKQLRATASGFQTATSNSFSITLGPAARLRIQTQPSPSATAGVPFAQQPIIWVEDAGGNRVTTNNTTVVTATRLSGTGTLQGILTATAVNGIVTFSNLSHNVATTLSILFSSGTLTPDTSDNILVSPAAAARLAYLHQPTITMAGAVITPAVTLTLLDAFGNSVSTTGTSVTITLSSGTGVLNGTLSRTTTSGVATFGNLSINSAGKKTLRASSGSLTAAVSDTFAISPGPPRNLVFVQQPTNAVAASPISPAVTVQIRDSLGNDAASSAVPVTLNIASGNGTLSGTTTRSTNSSGIATFTDLSINLSGSKTLSASSPGLTTGVSTTFTISAGAATRIVFVQQPTNTLAGAAITPAVTVQLKDAQGNNVRTAGISTSISLSSGTGALAGTIPQLTDASGIAAFNNLVINLSGTKRLTASSGSLASAISDTFKISAATASRLEFTTNPGGGSSGVPFAVQPAVTLEDAYGNPVLNVAQSVTLAIQNNAGPGGTLSGTKSTAVNLTTGRATFSDLSIDKAGNGYTLTATGSTVSTTAGTVVSAQFSVGPGAPNKVRVENAPNGTGTVLASQNVSSGTSITVHAISRDLSDNFVANVAADSWSLVNITGDVVPADLVPSADRKSATFTGRLTGSAVISATVNGLSSVTSGKLTVVVAGAATQIRVETAANGTGVVVSDRTIASGNAVTVYAVGRDGAGNFISNSAADSWSLQSKTGGIADGDLIASPDKKSATFTGRLVGTARIRATLGSLAAVSSGILTVVAGPATSIAAASGTPQSTRTGTAFPARFSARVRDAAGNTVQGVSVAWSAPASGASGTFAVNGSTATSDSNGVATSGIFTANTVAGSYTVIASLPWGIDTAAFSLTNTAGATAHIGTAAGSPQSTQVTKQYPVPLAAIVTDSSGNAAGGVSVTFAAPLSGASGTFPGGSRTATVATNAAGIATAPAFVANSIAGPYQVVATTPGIVNGTFFELRNTAGAAAIVTPSAGSPQSTTVGTPFATGLRAIVTDSSGNFLPGILVTFTAPSTGASANFTRGRIDSVLTDGAGSATASTLTANGTVGSYTLAAKVPGVSTPASFLLSNLPGPVDTFFVDGAGGGKIGNQVAQVPFNVRVRAHDRFGNLSTAFGGTVDITSNGVLSQAGTSTAPFESGMLTSHTVAMQNAGRFILMATRTGGAETGRSDTFAVVNPAPTLTKISPTLGRRGQSLSLSVYGSGFIAGVTTVSLGDLIATSTTVLSGTELAVAISIDTAAATGPRDVFVFNGPPEGGIATLTSAFVVGNNPSPTLASLTPDSGTVLQQLTLVFTGNNFIDGITHVNMGAGILVNLITVDSATRLTANISIAGSVTGGTRKVSTSNAPPGGGVSDSVAFHVAVPPTPYPLLDSPADATPEVDTLVTFRWHRWLTSGILYRLQISTTESFATIAFDDSTIADTSRRVGSLVHGVTYYWRVFARNLVGTSAPSPTRSFTPSLVYPATISLSDTVAFPVHSARNEYDAKEFRLVGLPGKCNVPLKSFLPGTKDVDWVAYWDNGAESNYLVPFDGNATFNFSPGRAFWILNKGPMMINASVPTLPLDSTRSVEIPLHAGWNLITNPFHTIVQWPAVKIANGPASIPDIWAYDGSFARTSTFMPFAGYLFDNPDNRTAILIPFGRNTAKSAAVDTFPTWQIRISLSSGNSTDEAASIGVSRAADRGRDPLDLRMPRGIGEAPGVFFERPGWDPGGSVFATDMRAQVCTLETWPMSVRAPVHEPARLSFSGLSEIPAHHQVLLIDDNHGRSVNLRERSEYPFIPATPVSRFRIVVGTREATQGLLTDLLPKEFSLGSNFPNPFNPSTTIPVAVPRNSTLTLKVYTILGEDVQTLFAGLLEPGRYWFVWDGRNARGRTAASGVYVIRLTTDDGQHFTGKMLLMK
jgi:hypothetical protein